MAGKIDTVSARSKLKPQREPYWHRISKGCSVGFRKMSVSSGGVWHARYRAADGKLIRLSLGVLEEYPDHERFDRAVGVARDWFEHIGMGGSVKSDTVLDACSDYVKHVRHEKGDKAADDIEARYSRWVETHPIHKIELRKLSKEHVRSFRRRLIAAPVKVNKRGDTRVRAKDSINRDMTALRAALNHAFADGKVTTDFAWREALRPIEKAGRRRELYLDRGQRLTFIRHAQEDLAKFLRGLALLPLRPGALAGLTVADFDSRIEVLKIGVDKHGKDRKIKLPARTADFFKEAVRNKSETDPLFTRADGKAWDKDTWCELIKLAVEAAGLPAKTTAYTLRHSVITDLVHDGLDLLTVAQISGTSVAMIEKYYGHLRANVATIALSKLAL